MLEDAAVAMLGDVETIARDTCPCGNPQTHDPTEDASCEWSLSHTRAVLGLSQKFDARESAPFDADCGRCADEAAVILVAKGRWVESLARRMYVCPLCGDQRCPKASDHNFACTNQASGADEQ